MNSKNQLQNQVAVFRWAQAAGSARRRMERICRLDRQPTQPHPHLEEADRQGLLEEADRQSHLEEAERQGLLGEGERQSHLEEAERVGRRFYSGSVIRTVFTFFDGSQIQGSELKLEQAMFHCQGFGFYPPDQILGGWIYLLTLAGEKTARLAGEKEPGLTDGFYRDAWATALTETGRELLQKRLAEQVTYGQISGSFGPGYYGMEPDQLPTFLQALDGARIGVGLSEGGALTPPKSCAGFYLWLSQSARPMPDSCKSCQGRRDGCDFCMKKAGGKKRIEIKME